jgi:hypothetical protein
VNVILNAEAGRDSQDVGERLVSLARTIPHLPAFHSSGLFMANGSRFYVDCGAHPELATPECANPWDICRYLLAGDRMLLDLAGRLKRADRRIDHAFVRKGNVDYKTRATWGCHESYLHGAVGQRVLSRQIIPHLVTRILFSGAGGFDCFSPGIDFMLSPRVAHLRSAISGDSTNSRGIFHTKDEPLCGRGHHRLHVLCGESLCSEKATWLKVATTALVVALIDNGKRPGEAVDFIDPVAAMRVFATDPTCSRTVTIEGGRAVTALEIQHGFLKQAEAHADAAFMPSWAGEVCRQWRAMLDRLRQGPGSVCTTLDWAIKLMLYQNHARRRGTTLETLAKWSPLLVDLSTALRDADGDERPLTAETVLAPRSPLDITRKSLTPKLRELGLDWDGLAPMLALRLELFEIDTRYSILGEEGIFAALDRGRVLDHHFAGVDNITHALENPPAVGRAAIRGRCIRRVAGQNGRFAAEWDGVMDLQEGRQLDLHDPFCNAENWVKRDSPGREPNPSRLFREGRYAEMLDGFDPFLGLNEYADDIVLGYARLGQPAVALAALHSMVGRVPELRHVALKIWIHCSGWVPAMDKVEVLLPQAARLMAGSDLSDDYSGFVILACKALFLMHRGLYAQSEEIFQEVLGEPANALRSRMYARTQCFLAELLRRLGRPNAAMELVEAAARTHRVENLMGDSATHSLPLLAKLTPDNAQAGSFLQQAETIHRMQRNNLGLAHALCIRARRFRDARHLCEVERLQRAVPVLTTCEVARRIVSDWPSWVTPGAASEPMDYWGL